MAPAAVLDELAVPAEPYAVELIQGIDAHQGEVDALISTYAEGWTLARMPSVDRAVLRIGVYELVHCPEVPTGAVIDEAVSLAKEFSTDEGGRYVNGVLASVARAHRPT